MPGRVVSRAEEMRAVADFLDAATTAPAGLFVEGEAGIGKTTLWLAALEQARDRGLEVLSARGAQAETALAYSALADLLLGVDGSSMAALPAPQRTALDRVLLRPSDDDAVTDQRAVAAGFLSVLDALSEATPTLVAIDDLQWLDPSSALIIAFATRRLSGRVGVLATVRTEAARAPASLLQLPTPDATQRIELKPLPLGALHTMLTQQLKSSFSRPAMARIHEISGGNPFYALELARAMGNQITGEPVSLPSTLTELVTARIGGLDPDVYDVMLAASCSAAPTVEEVAAVLGEDSKRVVALLEDTEANGIVVIDGHRLRFTHPLLAWAFYTGATPLRRRQIHRRLAGMVEQPEVAARHLALASTAGDTDTLRALDRAAESARRRGAPAAAAELVELAVGLGGNSAERRIRLAGHHFDAGNTVRARELLIATSAELEPSTLRANALHNLGVVHMADESFLAAADCFERALAEVGDDLALRVQVLATLAWVQLQAGPLEEAVSRCEEAVVHAERLGEPYVLSQVLSFRSVLYFIGGDGLDEASMTRAMELAGGGDNYSLITINPQMQHALLLSWTGQLDEAHEKMTAVKRDCVERGGESEMIFVAFHSMLLEIWRGNFTAAALEADDMAQRADHLAGNISRAVALAMQSAIAAYAGRVDEARSYANEGLTIGGHSGAKLVVLWQLTFLGFLEVSVGDYQAAANTVGPLVGLLDVSPNATETVLAYFLPDAAEALVQTGRLDEAEAVIDALDRNGHRLDRAWMLAVGGRCRGLLLAARGELDAAVEAVEQAMVEHDRLPMPFERARTQLVLSRLQRRGRRKEVASAALGAALRTFEELGTPLWAEQARAELVRATVGRRRDSVLTLSERRIAELAASGMTNRAVATALFVSPKTVEANLARVYRKLGIRSRAELGRRMAEAM